MTGVDAYIGKQPSPQKEVCYALRAVILETLSDITEGMRWGVPAFGDGTCYMVFLKDHVNLGFCADRLTREEWSLFDGGGKTTRHIKVASTEELESQRARIVGLLRLVWERREEAMA